MVIFTLYLNNVNSSQLSNTTNFNSCTWNVNWDQLFKGENYKYNKCRIRIKIVSSSQNFVAASFFNTSGVLTCNLPTNFNASNLYLPTLLNIMVLRDSDVSVARLTTSNRTNTAESLGVNIQIPKGSYPITINAARLLNLSEPNDFGSVGVIFNYNIVFHFELYN